MNSEKIVSIIFGFGGILITLFSNLVPSKREIRDQAIRLKGQFLERIALELNQLEKISFEIFSGKIDEPLRGDGRETKDYVLDYCQVQIQKSLQIRRIGALAKLYRAAHALLFLTIFVLISLPLLSLLSDQVGSIFEAAFLWIVGLELLAVATMYFVHWRVETYED